ncbi:protein of unknown function DUF159 [Coriobacterium glomerans PW2]|uniref:Abasic site processing protein n=1 Tax=Coriobacterium glomerans (strain ATCC 49209 / DSM 20642 / JCM 10262 / PW2) TaxID=700015 RepID=F2NA36_CORGP|nr:SOS response-associated peptidase family protein [Coriobacterium glomerans]AEB06430.1 protein of unknown function DUF159 [Coriobacterium glomerans PW2]
MCSEFKMIPDEDLECVLEIVRARRAVVELPARPARNRSAYPKSVAPVVVPLEGDFVLREMIWGYERPWLKAPIFNTRADTAMSQEGRNMWRDSLEHRRCIIPTLGFFEPHKTERTVSERTGRTIKQKFLFTSPLGPLLFIAGIYEDGHFSMMTTAPNACVEQIHNRMPVVLHQDELDLWSGSSYERVFDRDGFALEPTRVV